MIWKSTPTILLEEHVALGKDCTSISLAKDYSYDPIPWKPNIVESIPFTKKIKSEKRETDTNEWVNTLIDNSDALCNKLSRDNKVWLGNYFLPGEWDVICGRGKHGYDHIGNRRFRILIAMNLQKYVNAKFRADMSIIINDIVVQIRDASPLGGFVKQDKDGRWYEIGTRMAREKVAHTFRDCMIGKLRRNKVCSIDEKKEELMEAQDSVFRSCQINFSNSSIDSELNRLRKIWKSRKSSAK